MKSEKEELGFIFLRLQRTLILKAVESYESRNRLRLTSKILDLTEPNQIHEYLIFCRELERKPLVKLAIFVHNFFDHFQSLKTIAFSGLLYTKRFFPQRQAYKLAKEKLSAQQRQVFLQEASKQIKIDLVLMAGTKTEIPGIQNTFGCTGQSDFQAELGAILEKIKRLDFNSVRRR